MILWQRGDVWLCVKLKVQYIFFGKIYGCKTWKVRSYDEAKKPKKSHARLSSWSHEVKWQTIYISSFRRRMITKFGRELTYGKVKPKMNTHDSDHVITRGHVLNWKLIIFSSLGPVRPDLAGSWLMVTGSQPWSHMILWLCSIVRSHEKFKT